MLTTGPQRETSRLGSPRFGGPGEDPGRGAGQLYELYYDRIFRFCVHRLFNRTTAEDVTSSVFLTVARTMRDFKGRTEQDFRSWIYTIAANQANAHIRKTVRRKRLMNNVLGHRGEEDSGGRGGRVVQAGLADAVRGDSGAQARTPDHPDAAVL